MRIGIIADTHLPFEHPMYLKFVQDTFDEWECDTFVHIGDVVDNHAVAPNYDPNPDGRSAGDEAAEARKALSPWFKAFPKLRVCIGNHDDRYFRLGRVVGLSSAFLKSYAEVWDTPPGWEWDFKYMLDGVRYEHGTDSSGQTAALRRALNNRSSLVMGHTHAHAGVSWHTNHDSRIFAMNVGCGIDVTKYAFEYGKEQTVRPVLGCGIVIDGEEAHFIPMKIGQGERYNRSRARRNSTNRT